MPIQTFIYRMKVNVKRNLSLLIMLLMSFQVMAQSFTLKGKVSDGDGNGLELATVSCVSQGKLTMTNLKGEFSLTLHSADSVVVRFSMVGYKTRTRTLRNPRSTQTIHIQLQPMDELGEVVVTEKRRQTSQTEELDIKDIKSTPSTSGNAIEELIQQQAGVSTHNELSSQYNVRGGSFDENSVYINNVEVYRPLLIRSGQQEGLSVINPDMVERVGFSTGGFSAKYGDKMSSALDITYKKPKALEASAMVSLLGANAYFGMSTKKFSMTHGLRYKTNRYLLGSLQEKGEYDPNFVDYQTYITFQPNRRWTFDFLGNISENRYNFVPENRETSFGTMEDVKSFTVYFDGQEKDLFRTFFGTAGITRHINDSTHIRLMWSGFYTKEQECYDIQGQYWLDDAQTTKNLGVGTYMEHARNYLTANVQSLKLMVNKTLKRHDIEGALTMKWERVNEKSREWEMRDSSGYSVPHKENRLDLIYTLNSKNEMSSRRFEGYVQDVFKWHTGGKTEDNQNDDEAPKQSFYTLTYGVRFANWSFNKETIISPRASLAIVPSWNNNITMRFATGLYYQAPFYKELRDTTSAVNNITVVKLNSNIRSQRSLQFIAAVDYRFRMLNRPFKFTAEAYYKALSNLIPYNVQNVKVTYYGENLTSGYAVGLDLKLYGEFVPGTDSWLTFSLMRTQQKFNGMWVPMPTDQRFAINLHFTDYFPGTKRWKMTLRLAYADGLPFGAPHRGLGGQNFRAPAYKRADIGMSWLAYKKDSSRSFTLRRLWVGVDGLNLFGFSNVNSYYWVTDVSNRQWAVPNYLTGRQINGKVIVEF